MKYKFAMIYPQLFDQDISSVFNLPAIEKAAREYQDAKPFPYLVIKNFFKPEIAELISQSLNHKADFKTQFTDDYQSGKQISLKETIPPAFKQVSQYFAHPDFLKYLQKLTGDTFVVPDPYYNDSYAFYHIVKPGGVLGSHVDHSHHPSLKIPHTFNISVYITPDWKEEYGGELGLYDETGKKVVQMVKPEFNTAVVFACTPTAFHSVQRIAPTAPNRHSIYFAYYSVKDIREKASSSIPGKGLNGNLDNSMVQYETYFILPFKDIIKPRNWIHLRGHVSMLARSFVPPIFFTLLGRSRKS